MTKNLTEGREFPLLLSFMLPLMLGSLFQQFYNLVDTVLVGQFLGKEPMAATGAVGSVIFLIIGFANGLSAGFSIPVSQRFGAEDRDGVRRFAGNAIVLGTVISIVLGTVSALLCRSILVWMQTPEELFVHSYRYLVVLLAGLPATLLYNLLSGIIRAVGDSRTPLLILAVSSAVNVAATAILVILTPMGVAGAAVATLAAQILSCVLSILHIRYRVPVLRMTRQDFRPGRSYISSLCRNGIPMGLQYSITAVGVVILQTAINGLGADAVAAGTAAGRIYSLFGGSFYDSQGAAMATWSGQHMGAGKLRRIRTGVWICFAMAGLYALLCIAIFWFWGVPLARLFLEAKEVTVMADARTMMLITAFFYPNLSIVNVLRNSIQGMGFGRLAMVAGGLELIGRVIVAWVLVPAFGYVGACFSHPVAWVMADLFLIPAFILCYRYMRQRIPS